MAGGQATWQGSGGCMRRLSAAIVCGDSVAPARSRASPPGQPCSITPCDEGPEAPRRRACRHGARAGRRRFRVAPCKAPLLLSGAMRAGLCRGASPPPGGFRDASIHAPGHQVLGGPRRHHHPGTELRGLRHQRRVHRRQPLRGRDGGRCRGADGPVRPSVPARPATRAGTLRPSRSDARGGPPAGPHGPGAQPARPRVPAGCRGQHARAARRRRQRAPGTRKRAGLRQRAGGVRPRALRPGAGAQQHDAGRV